MLCLTTSDALIYFTCIKISCPRDPSYGSNDE